MIPGRIGFLLLTTLVPLLGAEPGVGNRLSYLDGTDPFYVHGGFPKLTTPQWVGERGVDAVVILAIDDMRAPARYEAFLRPILDRLKKVDGRAPVSIFCNALNPDDPQLTRWLQEGLSLEVHTLSHPCPLLAKGDWAAARDTYQGCVELLNRIGGNRPVAFRMPCCDSMNSPSPRFYAELFGETNSAGQFLSVDSSVMNITTAADASLPREWVLDDQGRPRFGKYLPAAAGGNVRVGMGSFTTTIENYPYPYVIAGKGWEFPAMVPSDWEAQNLQGTNNVRTVEDWLVALDVAVRKQGTFTFIFHPHGWIKNEQLVEFIDRALSRFGPRIKFLTLREAGDRLTRELLQGHSLRADDGSDHGVRVVDVNEDGYLDVIVGDGTNRWTRVWEGNAWRQTVTPFFLVDHGTNEGVQFGRISEKVVALVQDEHQRGAWRFENGTWVSAPALLNGLEREGQPLQTSRSGRDTGIRLRDVDGDGQSELLVLDDQARGVWSWQNEPGRWQSFPCVLPPDVRLVDDQGRDAGLRFVDLNNDGADDLVFSDPNRYSVDLFVIHPRENLGFSYGWSFRVREGPRSRAGAVPMIVRGGPHPNNGAWFARGHLWVQNEDTAHLPDQVDRRSFEELIRFEVPGPQSPEESLRGMEVSPGYVMELVAAEPLVQDPVAFEWGEDGRLWVAEMADYPSGIGPEGKPGGRIRVLEDTDGDGRYDKSKIFLDNVRFPSGVMPWRAGVLVSAAPEIFYAEDRDGDGRAEVRVTLLEGFNQGNQQHRINGFELGLDNWVYAANGDSGGQIRVVGVVPGLDTARTGALSPAFDLRGHDLRFRPDEGLAEGVAGQTQFGRRRDDWGNWFGNNNPNWVWHYWIEEAYLRRNPDLPLRSARQDLPNYEGDHRHFAVNEPITRFNWPAGLHQVTSANSPTPYRDDLPGMVGNLFISEPANNLIHREVSEPHGVSFRSHRAAAEQTSEFVASRDNWFRPTMLKTGPDGALYVADMYRLVIEHPEYALPGIERIIDLRAGSEQGRIYRIYPKGAKLRPFRPLKGLSTAALVAALDDGNGWRRDTAQRLLLHGNNRTVAGELRELVRQGNDPRGRLQALSVLDGLAGLDAPTVLAALHDAEPEVRRHAIRLSEGWIRQGEEPEVLDALLSLVDDPSVRVRFQLALTLGEGRDERIGAALLAVARHDDKDPQMRTAILSSARPHAAKMLEAALAGGESTESWLEPLTALAVAAGDTAALGQALRRLTTPNELARYASWQFASLAALVEVWQRRGQDWSQLIRRQLPDADRWGAVLAEAERRSTDAAAGVEERRAAIRLLGVAAPVGQAEHLASLVGANQPPEIEHAAVEALGKRQDPGLVDALLQAWPALSPARRTEVLTVLLSRPGWTEELLERLEQGKLAANQIGADGRRRLLEHAESGIRQRAVKVFGAAPRQDRAELLARYSGLQPGQAEAGRPLFAQHCASCHQLGGEGVALGPDLSALTDKSAPALLVAILDPNRAVEPNYVNYSLRLADGRELEGLIVGETANSITLRSAGGAEAVVLRSQLKEMRSLGLSLMPEGLEAALTAQQMADLIAFLQRAR